MRRPLVSIIIPAYNAAAYVRDAVDSALVQTYPSVEIVVVDDGSTDGTRAALGSYVKNGSITYIHEENKGLAGARNTGIRAARGEYIALLDSDDIFLPEKVERQVADLEAHPECGATYCDVLHFYEDDPSRLLTLQYEYYSGDDVFPKLLRRNFINPLTVMLRREAIEKLGVFDESYRRSEDWEYWVRLAHGGVRFHHLPAALAKYRMRKGSLSYGWGSEVQRKATELRIFTALNARMTPEERARYRMSAVLLLHRAKLWYAEAARYFPPLKWLHQWLQKRRLR